MLSRRVLVASRFLRVSRAPQLRYPFPTVAQQFRSYADKIVKVPEMAESISEGTLKQWSKQIGDFVEQDEEIATIETDKVGLVYYPISTFKFDRLFCRSMSQSMLRRLERSKNFLPMKRIPLLLVKIWSAWSLEQRLRVERKRKAARNPRNLHQKSNQRPRIQSHRRTMDLSPRIHLRHLRHLKRRSQNQRKSHLLLRNPSTNPIRRPAVLLPWETGKSDV